MSRLSLSHFSAVSHHRIYFLKVAISAWIYYNCSRSIPGRKMQLPKTTQEIADVIGREQALFLVSQLPRAYKPRNGSNVILYVPKTLNPSDRLVRILGWNDATKLVSEFRGMLIHPASCTEIYRPFRDRNIARLVDEGTPIAMVAEWFEVSERTVKNVLSEIPPHERRAANDNNRPIKHERRKAT